MKFYSVLTWTPYLFTLMLMVVLSGCAIYPVDNGINLSQNRSDIVVTNHKPTKIMKSQNPIKSLPKKQSIEHKILFIGDSHSNTNFGKILTKLLEKKTPAHVTTVASCGSSPSWWLQGRPTHCGFWKHNTNGSEEKNLTGITPKITKLMDIVKPNMVIVALGTNLIPENSIERRKYAEALMQIVTQNSQQCFWIGPPDARKFTTNQIDNVYQLLEELTSKYNCHLIDSRHYTSYPTIGGDGIHYSGKLGKNTLKTWAEKVYWDNIYTSLSQ